MKKIVRKEILQISKSIKDIDFTKEENFTSLIDIELPFAVLDVFVKNKQNPNFTVPALNPFRRDVRSIWSEKWLSTIDLKKSRKNLNLVRISQKLIRKKSEKKPNSVRWEYWLWEESGNPVVNFT